MKAADKRKILKRRAIKLQTLTKYSPKDYPDKLINHDGRKVYIGTAKQPLMKAGYGFNGVLAQDEHRQLVQCHACKEWLIQISPKHLKRCSGLTTREYKKQYGLNYTQALISDAEAYKRTQRVLCDAFTQRSGHFDKETQINAGKKGAITNKKRTSMQKYNSTGTCPLQLKTQLIEFIKCNRELPSKYNRGRKLFENLTNRYGSISNAYQEIGLPTFEKQGTNHIYTFADGMQYKINVTKMHDRNILYELLLSKCKVLQCK